MQTDIPNLMVLKKWIEYLLWVPLKINCLLEEYGIGSPQGFTFCQWKNLSVTRCDTGSHIQWAVVGNIMNLWSLEKGGLAKWPSASQEGLCSTDFDNYVNSVCVCRSSILWRKTVFWIWLMRRSLSCLKRSIIFHILKTKPIENFHPYFLILVRYSNIIATPSSDVRNN